MTSPALVIEHRIILPPDFVAGLAAALYREMFPAFLKHRNPVPAEEVNTSEQAVQTAFSVEAAPVDYTPPPVASPPSDCFSEARQEIPRGLRRWTPEDDAILISMRAKKKATAQIAERLGRSVKSCEQRIYALKCERERNVQPTVATSKAGLTRDGSISIAALEEAGRPSVEKIDLDALIDWATANQIATSCKASELLRRVNDVRAAALLPVWDLGAVLGGRGSLPSPTFGGGKEKTT